MRSMPTAVLTHRLAADGAMRAAQRALLAPLFQMQVHDVHFKCDTLMPMAVALLAARGITASCGCCETTNRRVRPDASG